MKTGNNSCDSFKVRISNYGELRDFCAGDDAQKRLVRVPASTIRVYAVAEDMEGFAPDVPEEAITDTLRGTQLAVRIDGDLYPLRDTAYKTLLERARISGSALQKMRKETLAATLNECLALNGSGALALISRGKVSAVHSARDYSYLRISDLLSVLNESLTERFASGVSLTGAYADHAVTEAEFSLPPARDLLGTYADTLSASGMKEARDRIMPVVHFITSDTGVSSARINAVIRGPHAPVHIGNCLNLEHRHGKTIGDFEELLPRIYAQYADCVGRLEALTKVELDWPANAMSRLIKKLALPVKASVQALESFESIFGDGPATAHDVFLALSEIPFNMECLGAPRSKIMLAKENISRALHVRWTEYDLEKGVSI